MKLVERGGEWSIEGAGKERARIGFATLTGEDLLYSVPKLRALSMV